jgi:glycerol uptake facilitator-like aquaporin
LLLAIVVGSGIMGEQLAGGNAAVALLANAIATGAGLYVLILIFAPISGAHFNPVVSLVSAWEGKLALHACAVYILAQLLGAFVGVVAAHAMFGLPLLQVSSHLRSTAGEDLGEVIATFGLLLTIALASRYRRESVAAAVACFITSAYWFTSSTSFANPAVTLARAATNTFAGIAPSSVPGYLAGQALGAVGAVVCARCLLRRT